MSGEEDEGDASFDDEDEDLFCNESMCL